MHDIVVGLTCFDEICFNLAAAGAVHEVMGQDSFWELVRTDVFNFIHQVHVPSIVVQPSENIGGLSVLSLDSDPIFGNDVVSALIRRQLHAAPGKEHEAGVLLDELKKRTKSYESALKINLPGLVRGALLMPAISRLLGTSDTLVPAKYQSGSNFPIYALHI